MKPTSTISQIFQQAEKAFQQGQLPIAEQLCTDLPAIPVLAKKSMHKRIR